VSLEFSFEQHHQTPFVKDEENTVDFTFIYRTNNILHLMGAKLHISFKIVKLFVVLFTLTSFFQLRFFGGVFITKIVLFQTPHFSTKKNAPPAFFSKFSMGNGIGKNQ
jgi:hypothetical protein